MDLVLDEKNHQLRGTSTIQWINDSPDSVSFVRMYMYLNAFSNTRTSYLRTGRGLGSEQDRDEADWGWVKVVSARQDQGLLAQRYVTPTDGNADDKSVLEITLESAIPSGDTLRLDLNFESKLPRTFGRSGFAEHGFMHWVHWYPKLGVYEQNVEGVWGWNCHQFLNQMEFYGDHGNYDVTVDAPSGWTLGGSGCLTVEDHKTGRSTYRFQAHDVIDFGWVASPDLISIEEDWRHVNVRLLHPRAHKGHVDRLMHAATFGLEYMSQYIGEYPYSTLTILDPPVYGLRSGFMEYPTYITGGSFYAWPKQIRTIESLILHEFSHQYFMQILANNEKEEPWLDEGFATYYEDRIMEAMIGEQSSLFDVFGYHVSNSDFTRKEYVSIAKGETDPIATRGWEINGPYKAIVYSKTATFLKTVERYIGRPSFDSMMKTYFERFKFTHPRGPDFLDILRTTLAETTNILTPFADKFIDEAIYGNGTCDYSIVSVEQAEKGNVFQQKISLQRSGDLTLPVEVLVEFEDGVDQLLVWDGQDVNHLIELTGDHRITKVEIDPNRKNLLDLDLNNNSFAAKPGKLGLSKYAAKFAFWFQQISNTLAVLL